jgi:hypothetical protein
VLAHDRRHSGEHILDSDKISDHHILLAGVMYVAACALVHKKVGALEATDALVLVRARFAELNLVEAAKISMHIRSVGSMKALNNPATIRGRAVVDGLGLGYIRTMNKGKTVNMAPHPNILFCSTMLWRVQEQLELLPNPLRADTLVGVACSLHRLNLRYQLLTS